MTPASDRPDGDLAGALASFDRDASTKDDLVDRAGHPIAAPTGPATEARFLEGWRVLASEQLLETRHPAP